MNNLTNIRYVFQKRTQDFVYSEENRRRLRKEIRSFLNDLLEYKISLRKLCEQSVSYEDRNFILNLSLILINNPAIAQTLVETKTLSTLSVAKETGYPHRFIEENQHYIIAYMLLLGTENHSFLSRQLSIGTKLDGNQKPEQNNLGIKLQDFGVTSSVLTPYGEFRFLDPAKKNAIVGDFITGSRAVIKPNRVLYFGALVGVLLVFFITFSYIFYQPVRSFTVMGEVEASFSFNRFGRLVEAQGHNFGGRSTLEEVVYSDKKLDTSLANFLDHAVKSNKLPPNSDVTLIVVTGSFIEADFRGVALSRELSENNLRIKVNAGNGEGFILDQGQ